MTVPAYACAAFAKGHRTCTRWCGDCVATKDLEDARDTHAWEYKKGCICGNCCALKGTRRAELPCTGVPPATGTPISKMNAWGDCPEVRSSGVGCTVPTKP